MEASRRMRTRTIEEDYEHKLAEALDGIDGQELEPEVARKARALEMQRYRKMNVYEKNQRRVLRKDQEAAHQGGVGWSQQRRQTTHEREIEASGATNQHRQGTRVVRSNSTKALRMLLSATLTGNEPKVLSFNDISRGGQDRAR